MPKGLYFTRTFFMKMKMKMTDVSISAVCPENIKNKVGLKAFKMVIFI